MILTSTPDHLRKKQREQQKTAVPALEMNYASKSVAQVCLASFLAEKNGCTENTEYC
jgi:hypothetical protein